MEFSQQIKNKMRTSDLKWLARIKGKGLWFIAGSLFIQTIWTRSTNKQNSQFAIMENAATFCSDEFDVLTNFIWDANNKA